MSRKKGERLGGELVIGPLKEGEGRANALVGRIVVKDGKKFRITAIKLDDAIKPYKHENTYDHTIEFVNMDDPQDQRYGELGGAVDILDIISVLNSHGYTIAQS
ncbi:MAG: hypothetical protein HZA34_00285 [Candidatus Pacebacteria bacterium]|nr:hypothetical protein [Candidatus Paceibacterota bacterium]